MAQRNNSGGRSVDWKTIEPQRINNLGEEVQIKKPQDLRGGGHEEK